MPFSARKRLLRHQRSGVDAWDRGDAHRAFDEIMQLGLDLGGTITGEHGVGLDKLDYMPLVFTDDTLDALHKSTFTLLLDPENRRLSLVWGLHCVVTEDVENVDDMVNRACAIAHDEGFASPGQRIIITAGLCFGGSQNVADVIAGDLRIHFE